MIGGKNLDQKYLLVLYYAIHSFKLDFSKESWA